MRAPDMPIGWPRAMAPPLTLTLSTSMPSSLAEARPTAAKASLISTRSRSAGAMPSLLAGRGDGAGRLLLERRVGAGDDAVGADLGEPGQAELLGLGLAHDDDRGGAVGDLRGGAGGDRAVLAEGRAQAAERGGRGVGADALVALEDDRVALALRDRDRDDLVVEEAVLPAPRRRAGGCGRRTRPAPRG